VIIATAGHVDHGKTTLVKALTGTDTDRLKEEKQRGMTIEPGYAYADLGCGEPLAFVDVPGHERFIRNMLAGVAAIDFALLVVAADDGPMPQTYEHLAILQLLGIQRAAVALTKIDRVPAERVNEVTAQLANLLAGTPLQRTLIFPLTATTGSGVQALRDHLASSAREKPQTAVAGNFRMAVDRSFTLPGAGLIVTGAVTSGAAHVGEEVIVSPQGETLRIRGIHQHNRPADSALAGRRCSLNLAGSGLKRVAVERGDWIVAPDAHAPTERIEVHLTVHASQKSPLAHWTPVHVHIGATVVNARVALLESREIESGQSGLAQLVLDRRIPALRGDRFVLRDQSARQTIGGGWIVDPFGARRGRAKPQRLAQLMAMKSTTPDRALKALLAISPDGLPLQTFSQAWNLTSDERAPLFEEKAMIRFQDAGILIGIAADRWASMRERITMTLSEWHRDDPSSIGPTEAALAARLQLHRLPSAWRAVCKSLCDDGIVVKKGVSLHLGTHQAVLSVEDAALLAQVNAVLSSTGLRPPIVGDLARQLDMSQNLLVDFLERASRLGHLVRVAKNRYFRPETLESLAGIARQLTLESESGLFDAASFRDRSGIGRNLTIEVLEFMDEMRITRFARGRRRMIS
jgi:selenocysteine-specific elongation factor